LEILVQNKLFYYLIIIIMQRFKVDPKIKEVSQIGIKRTLFLMEVLEKVT
jgi:hypothetical protein